MQAVVWRSIGPGVRPWGFTPGELTVPVDVWVRTRHELVNPSWQERLASRILNVTLNIRNGFFCAPARPESFEALTR